MPINQIDAETKTPTVPSEVLPPTARTPEETEYLKYLRDTMVSETAEPLPEGWRIYTTPKFLGLAALAAYSVTAITTWLAGSLENATWVPLMCTPEMAIFGLPIAVAGGWLAWTSPAEPVLEKKRTWKGRIATTFLVYLLLQTVALLFNFVWLNIFTLKF